MGEMELTLQRLIDLGERNLQHPPSERMSHRLFLQLWEKVAELAIELGAEDAFNRAEEVIRLYSPPNQ